MFHKPITALRKGALYVGSVAGATVAGSTAALADQTAAETAIAAAGTTAQTVGWVVVAALAGLAVIKMVKRVM